MGKLMDFLKSREDISNNHLELGMTSDASYPPSYRIYLAKGNFKLLPTIGTQVDRTLIGYLITKYDVTIRFGLPGFSFTQNGASRKAHKYLSNLAREAAEEFGLKVVDTSQEDIARVRGKID